MSHVDQGSFTGVTHVKSLDALSVVVMMETCDHDTTILTVWRAPHLWWLRYRVGNPPNQRPMIGTATSHQWCLGCLIRDASRTTVHDRSAAIGAIKAGGYAIVAAREKSEHVLCTRCHIATVVNSKWQTDL